VGVYVQIQTGVNAKDERSGKPSSLWPVYMWSLSFLKPYFVILLLLVGATVVQSTAELAVPKFIQHFIDVILPERNWPLFYLLIGLLALVIVLMIGAGLLQNLLRRHIQEKAARDLQFSIFSHLRKLGFAYYEQNPVGQTLSFLNTEVGALQSLYRQSFPWLIDGVIFSIISVVMMLSVSLKLSAIVVPCFLIYYIFGPMLERKASLTGKIMSQNRVEENQKVYESVSALTELRVFSSEKWDLSRFLEKVAAYNSSMIKMYWYAYWRGTNRRLTYNIGGIAIFIYGYYLLQRNELSVGEFVSFLLFYFIAMHRLTVVVTNITEQKVLMYQAERLYRFMQMEPQVNEAENPIHMSRIQGDIRFQGVSFEYQPGQPVLRDLDLTIGAGKRVALVGTSGNGKSTLLKLVGRFYDPQEGQITLDGVPIQHISFVSLRETIGYVFQETYMFGSTVRDNIRFGKPDATEQEVIQAAKAAYAHDFIAALPNGYDTIVGERGIKLSGGQKQRVAIARMLIKNPTVILLDEATSALDNTSEAEVQKAFQTLLKDKTVIAVAHRLSTVKDFDTIVVIEEGQVKESGTYEELLNVKGVFYQLLQGQEKMKEAIHG
jgi:ATP-binding cassette, subfamily B, bacterial